MTVYNEVRIDDRLVLAMREIFMLAHDDGVQTMTRDSLNVILKESQANSRNNISNYNLNSTPIEIVSKVLPPEFSVMRELDRAMRSSRRVSAQLTKRTRDAIQKAYVENEDILRKAERDASPM